MPRKRKLNDMSNRCRICLASDACTSQLFVDALRPKIQNLEKCSSTEILDKPNYPKKICYICLYKLEMWSDFKSQFLKTNQTLNNHFKIHDPPTTEVDKVVDVESAIDDIFLGVEGKRPRVVVENLKNKDFSVDSDVIMKSPPISPIKTSILKAVDPNVEAVIINETEKKITTVNHTSDSSSSPVRKISRAKKVEREALTKRWEERKNALLAATGEIPSESESDNGTQLSPVQKARAKLNSSSEKDEQKSKKIQRALKNLETNMTEKYTVSVENVIADDERKTRSRRGNAESQNKEASPTKSVKSLKNELPKADLQKEPISPEKRLAPTNEDLSTKYKSEEEAKEQESREKNITVAAKKPTETTSVVEQLEESREDDDIEIIDVDDDTPSPTPAAAFTSQLVTTEVQLGNATYVVRTTLSLPNSASSRSDISLKTNGINIDATNQEGGKIDLLNSVNLSNIESTKENEKNGLGTNVEKCLNIEIEGMEAEALQRVQLELAKFIKEDIQKRLLDESSTQNETDPKSLNFKDSYESLEYQLKNIVEKVLRRNYDMDKHSSSASPNNNKISSEFVKAAEKSPVFQPEVKIAKFNLGKLRKTYSINNLHILEEVKRKRGVVGPLSKTLGKRTLKLPKRYDDFDITLPAGAEAVRTATPTPKPTVIKPSSTSPSPITQEIVQNDVVEPMVEDVSTPYNEPIPEEPMVQDEPMTQDEPLENNVPTLPITIEPESPIKQVEQEAQKKEEERKTLTKKQVEKKSVPENVTLTGKTITSLEPVLSMIKNAQPHVETILLVPTSPPPNAQVKPIGDPKAKSLPTLAKRSPLVNNKPNLKQILPIPTKSKPSTATSSPAKSMVKRQRHICGICGKELFSKEEAEAHVKSHKTDTLALSSKPLKQILPKASGPKPTIVTTTSVTTPPAVEPQSQAQAQAKTKSKPKLMRCKRCQAIVEAKEVRSHICNSVKFNCTLCECSFGAEHLLLEHIETHARNNKIVKKTDVKTPKSLNRKIEQERVIVLAEPTEAMINDQEANLGESQQSYSCFVCDKVFLEEDQMKEHLQMHCEEVANDSDADGHQCAFCGEKFQSEEILEAHVGNHLKDDGDEKINMMINMETRRAPKPKKVTTPVFRCEQCSETFSSSLQLAMHLPVHEDESMVVEEEPEEDEHYVCNVCDEIFDSPDELAEHLNTEHNGNTHMCILCETSFSSVRELQEHVSTHL